MIRLKRIEAGDENIGCNHCRINDAAYRLEISPYAQLTHVIQLCEDDMSAVYELIGQFINPEAHS